MFPETLVSERLRLERLTNELVGVHELYSLCGGAKETEGMTTVRPDIVDGDALLDLPHTTVKETHDFLATCRELWRKGETATYGVTIEDEVAGLASLAPDWERRTGTLVVWLAPTFRDVEYARDIATHLVDVVFEDLDLDLAAAYVDVDVDAEDPQRAAAEQLERAGGRFEARLRNAVNRGGELVDQWRYTLSRAEYRDG